MCTMCVRDEVERPQGRDSRGEGETSSTQIKLHSTVLHVLETKRMTLDQYYSLLAALEGLTVDEVRNRESETFQRYLDAFKDYDGPVGFGKQ